MRARFDPVHGVYRDCRWCGGDGCLACEAEAAKAYKAEFPDGPVPVATFPNTPEGMRAANEAVGAAAITKAFGEGGGGLAEILGNIAKVAK